MKYLFAVDVRAQCYRMINAITDNRLKYKVVAFRSLESLESGLPHHSDTIHYIYNVDVIKYPEFEESDEVLIIGTNVPAIVTICFDLHFKGISFKYVVDECNDLDLVDLLKYRFGDAIDISTKLEDIVNG